MYYDIENRDSVHTVLFKGAAGSQLWGQNSGFTKYPRYFSEFANIQSVGSGMPPRWRGTLEALVRNENISFNGLQVYTTDKELIRPSKEAMPFWTGTVAKFLAQDRKADEKAIEEMKRHGGVFKLLASLKNKNVAIRAEMKVTITLPQVEDDVTVRSDSFEFSCFQFAV